MRARARQRQRFGQVETQETNCGTVTVSGDNGNGNGGGQVNAAFQVQTDGLTATFDASNSTAPDQIVQFEWDFGDGETASAGSAQIQHQYPDAGTYNVTLRVTDRQGNEGEVTNAVTVGEGGNGGGGFPIALLVLAALAALLLFR